ncbi:hypothetical protein BA190_24795 [Labrys sp. WJW]|uniref:DUF2569 domain-containing protein n=1 Tax=Labrys sp. WJW TaxID=1737983 RepID=UPI00082E15D5|nr:DUF2569 domain-containing protein [Labrys sp. WJW]OCC02271.1 hypothetical protein BA190_24795 [Labrys sp. WJW]
MANSSDTMTAQVQDGPRGIGGWMILPIIGLIGTLVFTMINLYGVVTEWEGMKAIIAGENQTTAALRLPVAASLLGGLALSGLATLCLYRIFTHSPSVPRLMTIFYIGLVVISLAELGGDSYASNLTNTPSDPTHIKDLVRALIASAIWIPYFQRSRRVANTFRTQEAAVDRKIGEIF